MSTAILSGRYELLHCGHVKTIRRFAEEYDTLYVYVVDNPDSFLPAKWNAELLRYCVADLKNVFVLLDPRHFGRVTARDVATLPEHDVFLSCNPQVTEHLRGLGVNVREFERTSGYSSTDYKEKLLQEALAAWRKEYEA